MKLAFIGRGAVAQALARALVGHDVTLGVRNPTRVKEAKMAEAAARADAVILATPWAAEAEVAAAIAPYVAGKTLIDATNPVGMTEHGLDLVPQDGCAAADALQARLPEARVVKTFNQIGAEFIADPAALERRPVMFAAGDDDAARQLALNLVKEAGFEAVDAGPLTHARHLEALAMLWIRSTLEGDLGRSFGFSLSHLKE